MKYFSFVVLLVAAIQAPLALAELQTLSGNGSGTIDDVLVDAATTTQVTHWPAGADADGDHKPFAIDGPWQFTWDDSKPGSVTFTGVIVLGDHFTVTDAGSLGGKSQQNFYGYSHTIEGVAQWDAATRTLSFERAPKERDAGGASTVGQDKAPNCEKISGMFASKGCSAFLESNPELEGVQLNLGFGEDRKSFQGTIKLIHFSGSGMTKAETVITASLGGALK